MASERQPVSAEDVTLLKDPGMPHLSPDGRRIVFALAGTDEKREKNISQIWLIDLEGKDIRPFTTPVASERTPRWSPDGKWVAFLSNRDNEKETHLYVMPADGGEARRVTSDPVVAVTDFDWSPDSEYLVFTAKARREDEPKEKEERLWREVTRLIWKMDGEGWWDERWVQVWRVRRDGTDQRPLTQAAVDHRTPRWSPDGTRIAFISKRVEDPDRVFFDDIFVIPAEGGEPQKWTTSLGPITGMAWAPDSHLIAYIGQNLDRGYNSNDEVWIVAAGQKPQALTLSFDRSAEDTLLSDGRLLPGTTDPIWLDERRIAFLCTNEGRTNIYQVTLDGVVSPLTEGDHHIYTFHARPGLHHMVVGVASPVNPGELALLKEGDPTLQPLTEVNADFVNTRLLNMPEFFQVKTPAERPIDAWLLKPPNFSENKQYPLILYIHGGPHMAYGWSWFHEFQYLASEGYCVLFANPRGSQSYGEAFNDAIRANWGPPVQEDLDMVVDAVLERGFIDPQRLGVTGGSFGGFMTNWIIGHTDRYAAAVTQRCCSNLINLVGNDDVGHYFCAWEAAGCPWENWEWYIKHSPLAYVEHMHTPLLIIHSDQDHRCPLDQAEQLYRALRLLDREVSMVIFLGASHGLSRTGKPKQRVERLRRIRDWFHSHM